MPLKIGLTGGIGSGKSSVAAIFAKLGVEVIDTDEISHQLTQPESPALTNIRSQFGNGVFLPDGQLNRAAMRDLVFNDAAAMRTLEAILHPLIRQEVLKRLAHSASAYVLIVVPLLLEAPGYRELVDKVLVVDCDEAKQLARTMARSSLGKAEVLAIMSRQIQRKDRLAQADDVLDNNNEEINLHQQVEKLHEKYLTLANNRS